MRQLIKFFLVLLFLGYYNTAYSVIPASVERYSYIDYSELSDEELENRATFYYDKALTILSEKINDETTYALNLYMILAKKKPENEIYNVKLGVLYDLIGEDKQATSRFYQAIWLNSSQPETYYRFGNYYYKRERYRAALKMYNEALKYGYSNHYDTLYKLGDIYQKFGDTELALKFLKTAKDKSPNVNIEKKIAKIESENINNSEYYKSLLQNIMSINYLDSINLL